ncbi:hypothetical protein FACS1894126_6220 [Alphaproteobacteria bacterium]|nr:hypothetical protein FACS1894126_6220 [Alphaproteobacteria bacterium]
MINVEELILPISEDSICGKYLKYEHLYDQIKEYRREEDSRLTQGVWQTDTKKADWKEVRRLCTDALKSETKDLQIATWLLEASIVLDGFQGLNQGTLLLHTLCEKFWDDIYPLPDWENANNIARMAPIYFFTEKVAEKIVLTPLTSPMDGISNIYSLSDWLTVRHNIRTKNSNGLSAKDVKKSVNATPLDFFQQLESDINSSLENIKKLDNLLADLSGNDSPSFRLIYDHFNDINRINAKAPTRVPDSEIVRPTP